MAYIQKYPQTGDTDFSNPNAYVQKYPDPSTLDSSNGSSSDAGTNGSPITNWNPNISPAPDANKARLALGFANNPQQQIDFLNTSDLAGKYNFKMIPDTNTIVYKDKNLPDSDLKGNSNWGPFTGSPLQHPLYWGEEHIGATPELALGATGAAMGGPLGAGAGFAAGNLVKQGIGTMVGVDTRNFNPSSDNSITTQQNPILQSSNNGSADLTGRLMEAGTAGALGAAGEYGGQLVNKGLTSYMMSKLHPGWEVQPGEILPTLSPSQMGSTLPGPFGTIGEKVGQGIEWINNKLESPFSSAMKKSNTNKMADILNDTTPISPSTVTFNRDILLNPDDPTSIMFSKGETISAPSNFAPPTSNKITGNLVRPNIDDLMDPNGYTNGENYNVSNIKLKSNGNLLIPEKPSASDSIGDLNKSLQEQIQYLHAGQKSLFKKDYGDIISMLRNNPLGAGVDTSVLDDAIQKIPGADAFTDEASGKVSRLLDKLPELTDPADLLEYKQNSLDKLMSSADPVTQQQLGLVSNEFNRFLSNSVDDIDPVLGTRLSNINSRYSKFKDFLDPLNDKITKGTQGGLNTASAVVQPSSRFMEALQNDDPDASTLAPTLTAIMQKRLAASAIDPAGGINFGALRGAITEDTGSNVSYLSKLRENMFNTNGTQIGDIALPKYTNQLGTLQNLSENPQNTTESIPKPDLNSTMKKIRDLMVFKPAGISEFLGEGAGNIANSVLPFSDMAYNPGGAIGRFAGLDLQHPVSSATDGIGLADAMLKRLTSSQTAPDNSKLLNTRATYQKSLNSPVSPVGE